MIILRTFFIFLRYPINSIVILRNKKTEKDQVLFIFLFRDNRVDSFSIKSSLNQCV
jgi:hypothetical protein